MSLAQTTSERLVPKKTVNGHGLVQPKGQCWNSAAAPQQRKGCKNCTNARASVMHAALSHESIGQILKSSGICTIVSNYRPVHTTMVG
mmetsp:Transcript_66396/g.156347  ORF Transcript_66396/g.156347 Transcript_66396/m.156347 type:complete len:88 (-) Transcript_66396:1329-1592(-)